MAATNAFQNDEAIDPAVLVMNALSQLDTVHVRALARLADFSDSLGPWPDEEEEKDAFFERTGVMMRSGEQVPLAVLVALVNTGAVLQSTNVFGGGTHLHDVSSFGRQLLRELREADPDDTFRWTAPD
ncbi:MAG: hypothetical protein ABWX92_02290 [Mycetocola sp.]